MFGPGVSTMPSETRAKPSREVRWGTGRTRGENLRISSARNIAMSFRKLHREQFIRGGCALPRIFHERVRRLLSAPSPACGGGLGRGLLDRARAGLFPHPPRSAERVDLPRKRER